MNKKKKKREGKEFYCCCAIEKGKCIKAEIGRNRTLNDWSKHINTHTIINVIEEKREKTRERLNIERRKRERE
jgi:hypothetical protein